MYIEEVWRSLKKILRTMDVPHERMSDFRWLKRNLTIRNKDHKDFEKAMELITSWERATEGHKIFDGNL